ncbi:hypothetical protein DL89DRAFT_269257 [Linderina pennispora]|uniref:Uncharacterized protein n=1 Tax=Linderina pennispora TaxID=61395 RepID=A0A1Y1W1M6_9FUNG|nr:uncharacterized protein DL89DRAFT_269257 [Linderina pennispora]ORX67443.1 hypothetical protein DL89DRAFT_269257 [Linderina pennispora]
MDMAIVAMLAFNILLLLIISHHIPRQGHICHSNVVDETSYPVDGRPVGMQHRCWDM